jgi:anaerobic selenocysteine-containing dehydrogenase
VVYVENGRAVKVEPDPDGPLNRGYLCVKGRAILDYVYHPDRLKYPLRRVGERGSGEWQRISWDKATDIIAEKLTAIRKDYGPQAVATAVSTRSTNVQNTGTVFSRYFGSPNVFGAGQAQCFRPRHTASVRTYGDYLVSDFEGGPGLIVMWGSQKNISNGQHYLANRLFDALKQGAKLIVVDPRRTAMAARADIWQPVRPGTDTALLLSWLNVIISEDLYDRDFVEKWTNATYLVRRDTNELLVEADVRKGGDANTFLVWDANSSSAKGVGEPGIKPTLVGSYEVNGIRCQPVWQELKDRTDEYPPEKAAEITWVPADRIRAGARVYATTKPAIIDWGVAIDQLVDSHQNTRAICMLRALCNNIDIPGGEVAEKPFPGWQQRFGAAEAWDTIPQHIKDMLLGADTYRLLGSCYVGHIPTLKKAILEGTPYPVKALLIWGTNPLIDWADTQETYEVLKKVEFSVACDLFMTPSAQMADIVLPGASFLEKARASSAHTRYIFFGPKIIEPLGESRDEFEIGGEILRKCGLGELYPWKNSEEFYEHILQKSGMSWHEWKDKGWFEGKVQYKKYETDYYRKGGGFPTRTGKVELFSTTWRELEYEPLPFYKEPPETPYSRPDLAKEYPYILITGGKIPMFFHSEFRQVARLRDTHPDPLVQIHPDVADKLGIAEGDWVWIETRRGRCKQRAEVFDGMDPRIIHVEHHWWFPEKPQGRPGFSGAFESMSPTAICLLPVKSASLILVWVDTT